MSEVTPESLAKDLQDTIEKVRNLGTHLNSVDDMTTNHKKMLEEVGPALAETERSLEIMNVALQNLFYNQSNDQILIETVVRYMAGYQPGDFTKEMETVSQSEQEGKEPEGFTVQPKNDFDSKRFYAIAEDIASCLKQMRDKKVAETRAKMLEEQKRKAQTPKIHVVQSIPKDL